MNSYGGIVHDESGLCLDIEGVKVSKGVHVATCDPTVETQHWSFQYAC